ncbi:leucine-rich repeats and immunoglobulin-like domains protein 3 [Brachyhypopomus gauderio]|uniref:leucine-rich repeats and immunoglobulin-like domains protein 3 n=1 Tax=Brachyhypopomus gauderio TaxID=698409 RepID=UPI00404228FB
MSAAPQPLSAARSAVILLFFSWAVLVFGNTENTEPCPTSCTCIGTLLDCSRLTKGSIPKTLPSWITQLDLSHNKLRTLPEVLYTSLPHLSEIRLNNNELETIPEFGLLSRTITTLVLANNKILAISPEQLEPLVTLETLDLSNNNLVEVRAGSFPALPLKNLYLNNNRISVLEHGCFNNLSSTLLVLRLNRNRLNTIPAKIFQLPNLQHMDLSRNRVRRVEGLTFHGLHKLRSLKMQRNGLVRLMDGAFWGLSSMEVLQLEYNNLTEVSKGWLYGLLTLQQLHLAHNAISRIRSDAWEFCQKLAELDLSFNQLARLEEGSFAGLSVLGQLSIAHNRVSFIADGAFRGLPLLHTLDLKYNEISWTIEDMNGPFSALDNLKKLFLQGNRIRSVTKKSFTGLEQLEQLDLSNNAIMSIQGNAFSQMKKLEELHLNTSSLLCDCQLKWFPQWVAEHAFLPLVNASCAHPQQLKSKSVFDVNHAEFVCDDFPKPQITMQPETQSAIKGTNVSFVCSAASSSDSPMTFAWKKDNEALSNTEIQDQVHVRSPGGSQVTEYTSTLQLRYVESSSEGRYQCVISNHFGSTYSAKAKLTVHMLPSFTKMPMDLTVRAGATARLECAATGHPSPQIAWQKDGGTDFPAARERRMHVMPSDAVFFIVDVKTEDIGVYSCTAQNTAGAISANATLTVLETPSFLRPLVDRTAATGETAVLQCIAGGSPPPRLNWTKDDSPLVVTERHFFAAGNQLLIIVDAAEGDAGTYTCEMSNPLGTERGNVRLAVLPNPNCEPGQAGSSLLGSGGVSEEDGWTTVGIVIIAVVCCVVGTSLVWVVIIYHTRRRNEDCSVTNTDETNLPADIPSYLSSQGTLAERQDGYVPSESGSNHQYMSSSVGGFYMQPKDMNGLCQLDTGSEADMEAAIDPLLCHYQGPIGSLLRRGNMYGPEPTDPYTGCVAERPVCRDSYSASLPSAKKRDFYTWAPSLASDPFDYTGPGLLMQLPSGGLHGSPHLRSECLCPGECEGAECGQLQLSSGSYMGTFGKVPWRHQREAYVGLNVEAPRDEEVLCESLHAPLDADSDHEEDPASRPLPWDLDGGVVDQPLEGSGPPEEHLGSQSCT